MAWGKHLVQVEPFAYTLQSLANTKTAVNIHAITIIRTWHCCTKIHVGATIVPQGSNVPEPILYLSLKLESIQLEEYHNRVKFSCRGSKLGS